MDLIAWKKTIHSYSLQWLDDKIAIAQKAMNDAQESANSEEKSSAGDKYETGRAMSQNERDMHAKQLAECLRQKEFLLSVDLNKQAAKVQVGSLVVTSKAMYYIAISIGSIEIEGKTVFVLSPNSPVAKALMQKTPGETFTWMGNTSVIEKLG